MNVNDLNAAEKEQYKEVASELRCLVCQNQSLADSHASLAVDLKQKVAEQIRAGKTNEEIKSFMQDRYGEFVIYKPAYSMENAVLWLGPFVVLVVAVVLARKVGKGKGAGEAKAAVVDANAQWAEKLYAETKNKADE
ncbi:MAG: cytochrome c-type biogenesis protein CcmH [Burkholderiales bacterium]|jgi:cytochrome c-type biogenesis protein CcmH|uniref:cytochrome c-type biogenesis protein n=1 Tax=Limnobacter sp. TaxID=2003368 RepID=UPI00391FCADD|nr:cytochrome c-type biogenesis protein CcmH [Burkholderiales bacterium]